MRPDKIKQDGNVPIRCYICFFFLLPVIVVSFFLLFILVIHFLILKLIDWQMMVTSQVFDFRHRLFYFIFRNRIYFILVRSDPYRLLFTIS